MVVVVVVVVEEEEEDRGVFNKSVNLRCFQANISQ